MTAPHSASHASRHRCTITHVAPYGIHVQVLDLSTHGLLRIPEILDPLILQKDKATLIGTTIYARVIGQEKADGPLILTQR
jgi:predicted RNA-binding protein with RPS1 domain